MKELAALFSGFVFAVGLVIGGMTDPDKVIGFLDLGGDWDPSLAFVMGGAVLVFAPIHRWTQRVAAPVLARRFHLDDRTDVDRRLVVGAALFGVGWGIAGFCPGPALVSTMTFGTDALIFTGSMLTGMAVFAVWQQAQARAD